MKSFVWRGYRFLVREDAADPLASVSVYLLCNRHEEWQLAAPSVDDAKSALINRARVALERLQAPDTRAEIDAAMAPDEGE